MSDLVGNPEDRYSHDAAHIINYNAFIAKRIFMVHNRLRNVTGFNKTRSEAGKKCLDCAAENGVPDYGWEGGERRKFCTAFHMPFPKKHLGFITHCPYFH